MAQTATVSTAIVARRRLGVRQSTITRLPLARHIRIPAVMRQTVRIVRALARADGLVGYSLKADLVRKTFWTVSAWESDAALRAFAGSHVHRAAMRRVGPHMAEPQIETLSVTGRELPLSWADIRRRLDVPLARV